LASTPAMFNSTITKDDGFLCPVDGAIMITGKSHVFMSKLCGIISNLEFWSYHFSIIKNFRLSKFWLTFWNYGFS
jgi:hypothetical protein